MIKTITTEAINLLKELIQTPSFSRQEDKTADCIEKYLTSKNIIAKRHLNNVFAYNKHFDKNLPTVLLNSHHDTVKVVDGWTKNPHGAEIENDTLYGLGSNDAGASLVGLIATFIYFYEEKLAFNLVLAATAEEEISGKNGIAALLPLLPEIDFGLVGEPTLMDAAIAEKGLMVIDAEVVGKAGHAAREEGINSIYLAIKDIEKIRNFEFAATSPLLGNTKMSVTQIEAGHQHNVVPDKCKYVIDVRTNEFHANEFVFETLKNELHANIKARSFRLNSSRIDINHPLVQSATTFGAKTYGSPTLSDQALMSFPTMKMGIGDSARSHTADEYILLSEIENGIKMYINIFKNLNL